VVDLLADNGRGRVGSRGRRCGRRFLDGPFVGGKLHGRLHRLGPGCGGRRCKEKKRCEQERCFHEMMTFPGVTAVRGGMLPEKPFQHKALF
jgi:hypothetical protein